MKSKKDGGFSDRSIDPQALLLLEDLNENDAKSSAYQTEETPIFLKSNKVN